MADSVLPLNTGSGGKTLDTESLTGAGAVVVERQRLEVAGAALAEIARVINSAPAGTEYALVVRPIAPASQTVAQATAASLNATVVQGTAAAIAGAWPIRITDGVNSNTVKPASTASVAADTAQVVALHPTTPLPAGTNTIGTVTLGADPDTLGSGSITATDAVVGSPAGNGVLLNGTSTANSYVAVLSPGGDTAWTLQLTGTFGGGTVYYEVSLDSTTGADGNWAAVNGRQTGVVNTMLGNGSAVAGFFRGNTSGIKYFRVRMVGATAPNVAVLIRFSSGPGAVFLNASIPAGTNNIGAVTAAVDAMGVAAQLSLVQSNGAPSLRVYNDQEQGMLENIFIQMQRQTELLRAILAGATNSSLSDDELDALRST